MSEILVDRADLVFLPRPRRDMRSGKMRGRGRGGVGGRRAARGPSGMSAVWARRARRRFHIRAYFITAARHNPHGRAARIIPPESTHGSGDVHGKAARVARLRAGTAPVFVSHEHDGARPGLGNARTPESVANERPTALFPRERPFPPIPWPGACSGRRVSALDSIASKAQPVRSAVDPAVSALETVAPAPETAAPAPDPAASGVPPPGSAVHPRGSGVEAAGAGVEMGGWAAQHASALVSSRP